MVRWNGWRVPLHMKPLGTGNRHFLGMPSATRGFTPWLRATSDVYSEHKHLILDAPLASSLTLLQHVKLGRMAPFLLAGVHVTSWTRLHPSAICIADCMASITSTTKPAAALPLILPIFLELASVTEDSKKWNLFWCLFSRLRENALLASSRSSSAIYHSELQGSITTLRMKDSRSRPLTLSFLRHACTHDTASKHQYMEPDRKSETTPTTHPCCLRLHHPCTRTMKLFTVHTVSKQTAEHTHSHREKEWRRVDDRSLIIHPCTSVCSLVTKK